jgi:hypothetical protein
MASNSPWIERWCFRARVRSFFASPSGTFLMDKFMLIMFLLAMVPLRLHYRTLIRPKSRAKGGIIVAPSAVRDRDA